MAGPGPVIYLDVDDEITSAAARVRAVEGTRVALVVPQGSRIATSRINFRLLARDAGSHGRRLAVIAPDAASRALAAAAGLEVFSSVGDYETAMADPAAPPPVDGSADKGGVGAAVIGAGVVAAGAADAGAAAGAAAAGPGATAPAGAAAKGRRDQAATRPPAAAAAAAVAASDTTTVIPTSAGTGAAAAQASEPDLRPRSAAATTSSVGGARRRRFGGGGLLVVGGLVLLAGVVVAGVAGYLFLPSATVVITPLEQTLGPTEVTVTADPDATAVDVTAGIVPAETRTFDVSAAGTYEATGERVEETTATGAVRWQNCDPTASYTIDAGTVVRTRDGVRFTTDERVFLPVAGLSPPSIDCQTRDVGITAAAAGPAGNVAAGTITVIPSSLNSVVITVRNPSATTGGARETFPKVTQADVDAALKDLDAKLAASFVTALAAPDAVPPDLTLFPETGQLGDAVPDSDPQALVGQEVATFDLAATTSGTATAVDETPVAVVAEAQLKDSVSEGYSLVPGSVESTIGDPTVNGQTVTFPARAVAKEVRQLDAAELESLILGLTPEAAEQAVAPYGTAKITLSPDWATTIPTYAFRVDLTIDDGGLAASPGPSASPARSPAPSKSPAGSPSSAPSPSPTPS